MQRYKSEQEYYRTLLIAMPDSALKEKQEVLDKYRQALYPYVQRAEGTTQQRIKAVLDRAYAQGPILIGGQYE